mmetsp:Transcript_98126/g.247617  ORF Transcript_98126/g.247617 Transcript_98126/m.247617 type:complete len:227 (+) Transcript_98126:1137-1817(+)
MCDPAGRRFGQFRAETRVRCVLHRADCSAGARSRAGQEADHPHRDGAPVARPHHCIDTEVHRNDPDSVSTELGRHVECGEEVAADRRVRGELERLQHLGATQADPDPAHRPRHGRAGRALRGRSVLLLPRDQRLRGGRCCDSRRRLLQRAPSWLPFAPGEVRRCGGLARRRRRGTSLQDECRHRRAHVHGLARQLLRRAEGKPEGRRSASPLQLRCHRRQRHAQAH